MKLFKSKADRKWAKVEKLLTDLEKAGRISGSHYLALLMVKHGVDFGIEAFSIIMDTHGEEYLTKLTHMYEKGAFDASDLDMVFSFHIKPNALTENNINSSLLRLQRLAGTADRGFFFSCNDILVKRAKAELMGSGPESIAEHGLHYAMTAIHDDLECAERLKQALSGYKTHDISLNEAAHSYVRTAINGLDLIKSSTHTNDILEILQDVAPDLAEQLNQKVAESVKGLADTFNFSSASESDKENIITLAKAALEEDNTLKTHLPQSVKITDIEAVKGEEGALITAEAVSFFNRVSNGCTVVFHKTLEKDGDGYKQKACGPIMAESVSDALSDQYGEAGMKLAAKLERGLPQRGMIV